MRFVGPALFVTMEDYATYQNPHKDGEFRKLSRKVADNVEKISQNAVKMQKMVSQLGSSSDSETFKNEL